MARGLAPQNSYKYKGMTVHRADALAKGSQHLAGVAKAPVGLQFIQSGAVKLVQSAHKFTFEQDSFSYWRKRGKESKDISARRAYTLSPARGC